MITLTYGTTVVALSDDMYWSDEFDWQTVEQTVARSVTGAMIVQSSQLIGGRPISLQPPDDNSAWMKLSDLNIIKGFASVAGRVMVLKLRGISRSVVFSHQDKTPVSAKPVVHYSDPSGDDAYLVSLKFMEV